MTLPDSLSAWCLWLFFLWYGLAAFVPALSTDTFRKIGAILALGFVLFNLLGMWSILYGTASRTYGRLYYFTGVPHACPTCVA